MQNFGDLSMTMGNFQQALNKETLFRPENRNVILGDEPPSCQERLQRQHIHCACFPRGHENGGQRRESYTSSVIRAHYRYGPKNEGIGPTNCFSKAREFCGVVAAGSLFKERW